jgi:hypothetical protein
MYPIQELLRRISALESLVGATPVATRVGVEFLVATDPAVNIVLSLDVQVSVLDNNTGVGYSHFILPDGSEGLVKEIVYGNNTNSGGKPGIAVRSTNSAVGGNDNIDMVAGNSIRLVWKTSLGGWVAVNACSSVNQLWD